GTGTPVAWSSPLASMRRSNADGNAIVPLAPPTVKPRGTTAPQRAVGSTASAGQICMRLRVGLASGSYETRTWSVGWGGSTTAAGQRSDVIPIVRLHLLELLRHMCSGDVIEHSRRDIPMVCLISGST